MLRIAQRAATQSLPQFSVQLASQLNAQQIISSLSDSQLDEILHPWRGYTDATAKQEPLPPVEYVLEKPSEQNEKHSLQSIVRQYGAYPTVGLLGAALASKELISVDAHTVFPQLTFLTIVTLAFSAVLPDVLKSAEEAIIANRKYWNDFNQLQVELVRTSLDKLHAAINTPDVLRAAKAEMNEVAQAHYKFLNYQPRAVARKDVIAKLEAIQRTEKLKADEARASLIREVMSRMVARARELSAADRAKFTEMAIDALEGNNLNLYEVNSEHPVFKHSQSVLNAARESYLAKLKQ